jgi:hypothetical protein
VFQASLVLVDFLVSYVMTKQHLLFAHPFDQTWDLIIPGKFGPSGFTGLLFYERSTGTASFYDSDGNGNIIELNTYSGTGVWETTWDIILDYGMG